MKTEPLNPVPEWYVLRTRPQHEKTVYTSLKAKGFPAWLPLQRQRSRRKDRVLWISVPLFSGYVFVQMSLSDKLRAISTHGVHKVVADSAGQPIPVSGTIIPQLP